MAWGSEPLVTSSLEWDAPAGKGCPNSDEVARAVEARLGRRVFVAPTRADVRLRGTIVSTGAAPWTVTLTLHDRQEHELGTRELRSRSRSCGALAETLPVVIALLIDLPRPHIDLELPETPAEPTRAPDAPTPRARLVPSSVPKPMMPAPTLEETATKSWSFGGALLGEAVVGIVPNWAWGMAMSFDIRPPVGPPWSVWASQIGPSTSSPSETGPGVLVSVRTAGILACPSLIQAAIALEACAGMGLDQVSTRGIGYDENLTQSRWYSSADAGLRLRVPIFKTVAVGFGAMAEAPLWRARFVGEGTPGNPSELFRAEAVGARFHVGLMLGPE